MAPVKPATEESEQQQQKQQQQKPKNEEPSSSSGGSCNNINSEKGKGLEEGEGEENLSLKFSTLLCIGSTEALRSREALETLDDERDESFDGIKRKEECEQKNSSTFSGIEKGKVAASAAAITSDMYANAIQRLERAIGRRRKEECAASTSDTPLPPSLDDDAVVAVRIVKQDISENEFAIIPERKRNNIANDSNETGAAGINDPRLDDSNFEITKLQKPTQKAEEANSPNLQCSTASNLSSSETNLFSKGNEFDGLPPPLAISISCR